MAPYFCCPEPAVLTILYTRRLIYILPRKIKAVYKMCVTISPLRACFGSRSSSTDPERLYIQCIPLYIPISDESQVERYVLFFSFFFLDPKRCLLWHKFNISSFRIGHYVSYFFPFFYKTRSNYTDIIQSKFDAIRLDFAIL